MKKILFTLTILCYTIFSLGQDLEYDENNNLFGSNDASTDVAFYGSFDIGYQELNDYNFEDNQSVTVGLSLAAVLNDNFFIGIYGFTNSENKYNAYLDSYLRYGAGGFLLGVRLFPKIPIHISIPLKVGFGTISYADDNWGYYNTSYEEDLTRDSYFVVEPGIELELSIVKYFKISGGISYKLTDSIVLINTPNDILNGMTFNFSIRIIYP